MVEYKKIVRDESYWSRTEAGIRKFWNGDSQSIITLNVQSFDDSFWRLRKSSFSFPTFYHSARTSKDNAFLFKEIF